MDPQLLDYYNQELTYMRESAGEFAALHPKVARRLGMHGVEVADPYVERLIEAFSFMSARMRIKLDAEFPRFTQRLLEVIYPNYVAPTPSMAVAQLHPSVKEGDFSKGFAVPRNTAFFAKVPEVCIECLCARDAQHHGPQNDEGGARVGPHEHHRVMRTDRLENRRVGDDL